MSNKKKKKNSNYKIKKKPEEKMETASEKRMKTISIPGVILILFSVVWFMLLSYIPIISSLPSREYLAVGMIPLIVGATLMSLKSYRSKIKDKDSVKYKQQVYMEVESGMILGFAIGLFTAFLMDISIIGSMLIGMAAGAVIGYAIGKLIHSKQRKNK